MATAKGSAAPHLRIRHGLKRVQSEGITVSIWTDAAEYWTSSYIGVGIRLEGVPHEYIKDGLGQLTISCESISTNPVIRNYRLPDLFFQPAVSSPGDITFFIPDALAIDELAGRYNKPGIHNLILRLSLTKAKIAETSSIVITITERGG